MEQHSKTFWDKGFVLIKDFFTQEEADDIVRWAGELEEFPEMPQKWMIYFESGKTKSRIENILDYHYQLNSFVDNRVTPTLNSVYGSEMNIFKDKMNWKLGHSKGFKAHQDQPAWSDFPPKRFVSVALFADNTTVENGCLEFVEGKHQDGLYGHNIDNKGELDPEVEKKLDWKFVTTTPRDILIFDSFAPHRSGDNTTDNCRRIFYFTYNKKEEGSFYYDYIKRKRVEFPPDIERIPGVDYKGGRYNLANPIL